MRRLLVILLLWAAGGCSNAPTTVLVDVALADGAAGAGSLSVSVYDAHGALVLDHAVGAAPPGRLVLDDLPDDAQPLRIVARVGPLLGAAAVETAPHRQVEVAVTLSPTTPDGDGDGVPDAVDNCPTVPNTDQRSANGTTGDACSGDGGVDLGAVDLLDGGAGDLAPVTLFDDEFTTAGTLGSGWNVSTTNAVTQTSGGYLIIDVNAQAGAGAEVQTSQSFGVGTTVEMRVGFETAGETNAHHLLGFANGAVSTDCSVGETEAAAFRGENSEEDTETKSASSPSCVAWLSTMKTGFHVLRVSRVSDNQVDFYSDGTLVRSSTVDVSTASLPVGIGVFTAPLLAPTSPILLEIDYVRVTKP